MDRRKFLRGALFVAPALAGVILLRPRSKNEEFTDLVVRGSLRVLGPNDEEILVARSAFERQPIVLSGYQWPT